LLRRDGRASNNAPNANQPETAMLTTLTMPAGLEMPETQRAATPVRVKVRSADELRNAIRNSHAHAVTLDGTGMNRVLRLDATRGLIEVQAATTWAELARYLAGRKLAIEAFTGAGLPAAVGDSVCAAAPGPDGQPVTTHVAALTLVMPDGDLRRADRDANEELFRAALGGQGLIGVIYSVTLDMTSLEASARHAIAAVDLCVSDATAAGTTACEIDCLLPPEELASFLAEVRAAAHEQRIALHAVSVRRTQPEKDSMLRWATREWASVRVSFGVRPTLGAGVRAAEIRRLLLELALARKGSFPLREARHATRAQLEACYPMLAAFLAEKQRTDPGARLQNAWYRDVLAKMRPERCEVRWERPER
jgi:FAD/FMN-containing dehydrogenase